MTGRDRRAAILASADFNGVDFVEVANAAQTELRVHFLNAVAVQGTLTRTPVIDGGETIRSVGVAPVADADWSWDGAHLVLTLRVAATGDFSIYRLSLSSPALDPVFDHADFSFKAECPSDLDCGPQEETCPPEDAEAPPINYLARDFQSFRQALLDFSALRYPDWQERSEGDFGVMFAEALSAVADDFSYMQDRVAAEATLATATQRRSAVRHARLVDYEPAPATAAQTFLQADVAPGVTTIAYGLAVVAPGADGRRIMFETGDGLVDRLIDPLSGQLRAAPQTARASSLWNAGLIQPYWFDDSQRCLEAGATSMYLLGRGYGFLPGQRLLIETAAESSADPPIRQIVQLLDVGDPAGPGTTEMSDPIFPRPVDAPGVGPPFMTQPAPPAATEAPTAVTRIAWGAAEALILNHDLTRTMVAGNIVPATQGRTITAEPFIAGTPPPNDRTPPTLRRDGPRRTLADGGPGARTISLSYTLAKAPLAWLPQPTLDPSGRPQPELVLTQATDAGETVVWRWFRWLLDVGPFDDAFTVDPARYLPIARRSDRALQYDYVDDAGDTLRFGDGAFGLQPDDGARFQATYRVGDGGAGNVAAGAVRELAADAIAAGLVAVTNPLPASGGADPEPLARIAGQAPQAFRAETFRAVLPKDYEAAAETLPWVQRAGTAFRWTGSWLTVFTTPDPLASEQVITPERLQLIDLLNRYRMAGYESYVPDPRYVSIDLEIEVCATPGAFRAQVLAMVVQALSPSGGGTGARPFFSPDNFTFGQPLERSALEAAVQNVPGVAGVICVHYRMRDRMRAYAEMPDRVEVATDQIIRCDNDPSSAERGALGVRVEGGR